LGTITTRILLVEDFKPHRSSTARILAKSPRFVLISEAEDGLEAVAQAQRLKPDVVLMDIGLPKVNGLEAARRILNLVPLSKIVFLTQETDAEVVREAFSLGGWAYVLKAEAATDLLAALASIDQGKRFVSAGLGGNLRADGIPTPE
jgi:DNA-binding NarL/FixJ family response regulator